LRAHSPHDDYLLNDPGFVRSIRQDLAYELVTKLREDDYIVFDNPVGSYTTSITRATLGVVTKDRMDRATELDRAKAEVRRLQRRLEEVFP